MNNPEKGATLGTEQRQVKQKNTTQKTKNMINIDLIKKQGVNH